MIRSIVSPRLETADRCRSDSVEFTLSRDVVLLVLKDGSARLLDFNGSFYGLSATAAEMLQQFLTVGREAAARTVADSYSTDVSRIEGDLDLLVRDLLRRGLLRKRGEASVGYAMGSNAAYLFTAPLLWITRAVTNRSFRTRAWALLTIANFSVTVFGWSKSITAWQHFFRSAIHTDEAPTDAVVYEIDAVTRDVGACHLLRIECKERALCCWAMLRMMGEAAELVVGVNLYPLASHCWCEVGSIVLTDFEDKCACYTPILRYD